MTKQSEVIHDMINKIPYTIQSKYLTKCNENFAKSTELHNRSGSKQQSWKIQ